jgi:hypothetical protein
VIHVQNVFHIPDLRHTLISACRCARAGVFVRFDRRNGTGPMLIGKQHFTEWREDPAIGLSLLSAKPLSSTGAVPSSAGAPGCKRR